MEHLVLVISWINEYPGIPVKSMVANIFGEGKVGDSLDFSKATGYTIIRANPQDATIQLVKSRLALKNIDRISICETVHTMEQ